MKVKRKFARGPQLSHSDGVAPREAYVEMPVRTSGPPAAVLCFAVFAALALFSAGCGSDPRPAKSPAPVALDPPPESIASPLTELSRQQVAETIDRGFARFLSRVELAAVVENGKFRGFRIVRFADRKEWDGTGLMAGDVILTVADQPIERPEQAFAVFTSLRTAERLEVSYERDGRPMRLSLPIVGSAVPASPAPKPAPLQPAVPPKIEVKTDEGEGSSKSKADPK